MQFFMLCVITVKLMNNFPLFVPAALSTNLDFLLLIEGTKLIESHQNNSEYSPKETFLQLQHSDIISPRLLLLWS